MYRYVSGLHLIFVTYYFEALPLIMPLYLAFGTGDTSVDEESNRNNRQCCSYHRAPSFRLACYIDPWITSQIFIFVFTLKIFLAGINVSFIIIIGVVLNLFFGHDVTSLVGCLFVDGFTLSLKVIYGIKEIGQCELVGFWVVV